MHPLTFAATHSGQRTQTDLDHANLSHGTYWTDRQTPSNWSQVSGYDKEGHRGPLTRRCVRRADEETNSSCKLKYKNQGMHFFKLILWQ